MTAIPHMRIILGFWLGLLLVHLAFWSGACGYNDLYEYATLVEQLWHHGTWALPDGQQSRFCWGFPLLLLPFQALGTGLECLSGYDQLSRWILAILPLLAATGACILILVFPGPSSCASRCLAALLMGLSACSLYYSRMLHLEPVVGLAILTALWLNYRPTWWSAGLVGLLLAIGPSCHFAFLPGTVVLALGMAWQRLQVSSIIHAIFLLVAYGLASGVTLVMNHLRYGSWNTDGYSRQEVVGWTIHEILPNLPLFAVVLLTVPWTLLALIHSLRATSLQRWCAVAIMVAVGCWIGTWQFRVFPLRYLMVWVMVASILLPPALDRLSAMRYGAIVGRWLMIWGVCASALVITGWQENRPFMRDPEHPVDPGVRAASWLFRAEPSHQRCGHYTWIEVETRKKTIAPYVPVTVSGLVATAAFLLAGLTLLGWTSRRLFSLRRDQAGLQG